MAEKIDWGEFEPDFASFYSTVGCPAKPIRLMVGLLILKQIYNLGDKTVMKEWFSNPYYQYLCGEVVFQWEFPCAVSDLVHFRQRIGVQGVEKILVVSILLHGEETLTEDLSIDTTVQRKNITYPTDIRLVVAHHQAMSKNSRARRNSTEAKLQIRGNEFAEKGECQK